jgi:hypothetical protein
LDFCVGVCFVIMSIMFAHLLVNLDVTQGRLKFLCSLCECAWLRQTCPRECEGLHL